MPAAGHGGLAATQGHATPASLIQAITGGTKADATRQVRVGISLLEAAVAAGSSTESDAGDIARPSPIAWHAPLREALMDRRLTSAQHDAIRRGLDPPLDASADANEVWTVAACQLIDEAVTMTRRIPVPVACGDGLEEVFVSTPGGHDPDRHHHRLALLRRPR